MISLHFCFLVFSKLSKNCNSYLTGCDGADSHNTLKSASSAYSEHFPRKIEKKNGYYKR